MRAAFQRWSARTRGKELACSFQTYLLLVVQTLVVVLEDGHAFRLSAVVLCVCVGHVAREDFLPEGKAARGAWWESLVAVCAR